MFHSSRDELSEISDENRQLDDELGSAKYALEERIMARQRLEKVVTDAATALTAALAVSTHFFTNFFKA